MPKKLIIIGAGIAGLSAGCYGQINGYDTEIYEMHSIPGGLCTSWHRKGYVFDGCIHWLMGVRPGTSFYKYWQEIGALEGMRFLHHNLHLQIEDREGHSIALGADIDELEKNLIALSPEDAESIKKLTEGARKLKTMKMPMDKPQDMYSLLDIFGMLRAMGPLMKDMVKLNAISIGEFASQLKSPFLREAIMGIMPTEYPLMIYAMVLATYSNQDAGWPMGGSLAFARAIEKSYLKKGGKIRYNTRVESIIVEDNKAVGVKLENGEIKRADFVLSAADGHTTIYKMLGGRYKNEAIDKLYAETLLAPTSVQVSLGVDCDLSKEPIAVSVKLEKPLKIGNVENKYFNFRHYGYDPGMAPQGKSAVTSVLYSDYDYWAELYKDQEAYKAEKQKIADAFI
ncbi:MAG: NAD(P)/FAD-dependent oxidoreductase, partial [Clostridia bacterium]|nr:NAD(P)/FAD-dependent oxidoreductase [Clostridia bacterium]